MNHRTRPLVLLTLFWSLIQIAPAAAQGSLPHPALGAGTSVDHGTFSSPTVTGGSFAGGDVSAQTVTPNGGAAATLAAMLSGSASIPGLSLTGDLHSRGVYTTGSTPGTVVSVAMGNGNYSGGSAQITNNLAAGVTQYPTAWSGYGIMNQPGGNVFGLFGRADLMTNGVATNELDSFNLSGTNPNNNYPPNIAFGSTDHLPIALQLVPFGTAQSAIGLNIAGPTSATFQAGIYLWASAVSNYGLFLDATATAGAVQPALIRAKQTASALTLQTMGAPAAGVAVLNVADASGSSLASIRANGDIGNAGLTMAASGLLYFSAPTIATSATAGGATALPATPSGYLGVVISGTLRHIPYY